MSNVCLNLFTYNKVQYFLKRYNAFSLSENAYEYFDGT